MDKKDEVRVCPQCGSTNLEWLMGGQTGDQYKCAKCNYLGIALKGNAKFIKKLQEEK